MPRLAARAERPEPPEAAPTAPTISAWAQGARTGRLFAEFSAADLAALAVEGLPKRLPHIVRKLKAIGALHSVVPGEGGHAGTYLWNLHSLPAALRQAIRGRVEHHWPDASAAGHAPQLCSEAEWNLRQHQARQLDALPPKLALRADARLHIVDLFRRWRAIGGWRTPEAFAIEWRDGAVAAPEHVRQAVPRFCAKSLLTWERLLRTQGPLALAGAYRPREAAIDATAALLDLAEGMIVKWPHLSASDLHQAIAARAEDEGLAAPSLRACQRWLADWKRTNRRDFAFLESPDAHKARFRPAFGSASEGITRLNQVWEFDATKADVMLADGQRYMLVAFIDVWSRRAMIRVHRTSSGAAIAGLLRDGMLAFGVPERVHTDNGSDFVSEHVTRVLGRLEIVHWRAQVGAPQQKPFIERFFGTFSHGLLKLLTGYVGHDVAARQKIESRRSFMDRLLRGRGDARPVELGMSQEELQRFCDRWCEAYHNTRHGGIGTTPALRAAGWAGAVRRIEDIRALDVLLEPVAGHRTVTKRGIRLDRGLFIAPELGDLVGEVVECRQDSRDFGSIYVFALDGSFICRAEDPERTGISREEIAEEAKRQAKAAQRGRLEALRGKRRREVPDGNQLVRDLIERKAASSVIAFPRPAIPHATRGLGEEGRAARADDAPVASPRTAAEARRAAEIEALIARRRAEDARDPEAEREARITRGLAIWDALRAGAPVSEPERAWFAVYELQHEFLRALTTERGVDTRAGHYRPIGKGTAAAG